jgi:hypothetical protein
MVKQILIFSFLVPLALSAQRRQYAEIGVQGGASNFIGDVGNYGIHLPQGYHGGLMFRYNFSRRWSVEAGGNYGYIQNADSWSNIDYRVDRNLSFQSEIWEGYLMMNFNFFDFEPGTRYDHTPFIFGGFGIFWFDPITNYQGNEVRLQPLGTEGQGTSINPGSSYALANSFFIFGMGYKWSISRNASIGIQSGFRSTYTDFLDDTSGKYADPEVLREENGDLAAALSDRSLSGGDKYLMYRGDPTNNDWYIFTGLTLQIKFEEFVEKCTNFARQ